MTGKQDVFEKIDFERQWLKAAGLSEYNLDVAFDSIKIAVDLMVKTLEQDPKTDNEMTLEEYRRRMILTFHNAGCDELNALCVLPNDEGFKHLEWLLQHHYNKEDGIWKI